MPFPTFPLNSPYLNFKSCNFTQTTFRLNIFIIEKLKNILYSNLIVAFSTGVLSAGFSYAIQAEKWLLYGVFGFFSTLTVYNGQRLFKASDSFGSPWLGWVIKHKKPIYLFVILSSIGAGLSFFALQKLQLNSVLLLLVAGFISVFYVFRIKGKNMREMPYIKIHLIAFTWVAVLVVFPLLNEGLGFATFPIALAHYLYVIAVTIPFDVRDLRYDAPSQKTIPQLIGINGAKILGIILLIAFFFTMIYLQKELITNLLFYVAVSVQIILVALMNEKRGDFYCAGLIDGAIALLGLSYFF